MEKKRDMAWKVLNRKIVFQDTWVQLEASSCELPDGRIQPVPSGQHEWFFGI